MVHPIVLIHGYGGEGRPSEVQRIYGDLPEVLYHRYGQRRPVIINLSRFITLEDGVSLYDLAQALHQALRRPEHRYLLESGFNAIVHSTGGLLLRTWLRHFSPRPSPLKHAVHLAPAHFGSGWAHLGRGQLARWFREVFQHAEPGTRILEALELGSPYAWDLHTWFLDHPVAETFGTFEYVMVGSEADSRWFALPLRYAHEDGSDGVVRVAAANLNYRWLVLEPEPEAQAPTSHAPIRRFYRLKFAKTAPPVPFAVLPRCAHSGKPLGIVTGHEPRETLLRLLDRALTDTTPSDYRKSMEVFQQATQHTYQQVAQEPPPPWFKPWERLWNRKQQYDPHAMVVLRFVDQFGAPVPHVDIYFRAAPRARRARTRRIADLLEHHHRNHQHPSTHVFYLRTATFQESQGRWVSLLDNVQGFTLQVTATEPETRDIQYVPFSWPLNAPDLAPLVHPHQTTLVEIRLLRYGRKRLFRLYPYRP